MYRKQFLLTNKNIKPIEGWSSKNILNYTIYYDNNIEYSYVSRNKKEIHLLGEMYDYKNPNFTNTEILVKLANSNTLNELFINISNFCGDYVLIYNDDSDFIIMNDACAQAEIYYATDLSFIGSQPKLILEFISPLKHKDADAISFYSSKTFAQKNIFIGESTHIENIKHLLPNHYVDIRKTKKTIRFYPIKKIKERNLEDVAISAANMLKGYMKAIDIRHNKAIAVTGGYDSRVLFLADLGLSSKYYVSKHKNMNNSHYDILTPKKLLSFYDKKILVIPDTEISKDEYPKEYLNSVDFPRYINVVKHKDLNGCVFISGALSEIARNYFGYNRNMSGMELSFVNGFYTHKYPTKLYELYIKCNKDIFHKLGYHLLDMFYWEEKMGNWAAKAKTEFNALGETIISPFNSRELFSLLLSVKRKYRDSHNNKLYNRIIFHLSNGKKEVVELPINPSRKQDIIRLMKKFRLYNLYKYIGLKTRKF